MAYSVTKAAGEFGKWGFRYGKEALLTAREVCN